MRRHKTNFIEYLEAKQLLSNGINILDICGLSGMSERTVRKIKQSTNFENYKYITSHRNKKTLFTKLLRILNVKKRKKK